jgi:predicted nucleotide-binding protein
MEPNDTSHLRRKRSNLLNLLKQFDKHDSLLKDLFPRSQPWEGAPDSMMNVFRDLFEQAAGFLPEKGIRFDDNNDIDVLRSQIISVSAKISSGISSFDQTLGDTEPPDTTTTQPQIRNVVDPRKVFVIYGRNEKLREAMFAFLRAVNLAPMEWGQVLFSATESSPNIGEAIFKAFDKAQAWVVLLSGDDLARLGSIHVKHDDDAEERTLTPQARPNVVFEAGMAFGRLPGNVVLTRLGRVRKISDILGRYTVSLNNSIPSRQLLAERLMKAGCAVDLTGNTDWHNAGNFDAAMIHPDAPSSGKHQFGLKVTRKDAQDDPKAGVRHKIWIEIRNDSEECYEIRYGSWKATPLGINSSQRSKAFQLRLDGNWYPPNKGLERLNLPSGEFCQTWISFDDPYSMADIEQRCHSEGRIGILVLLVNGVEVDIAI